MRQASLKPTLLRGVSLMAVHGATVHVVSSLAPFYKAAPSFECGAYGLVARVRLWLRLIFGFGLPRCESVSLPRDDNSASRSKRRAFAHRARRRASARKAPAHDLEMLMAFVPGARRGLTLNQYRERFARISVLGRAAIYHNFVKRRIRRQRIVRMRMTLPGSMGAGRGGLCAAPLWPD